MKTNARALQRLVGSIRLVEAGRGGGGGVPPLRLELLPTTPPSVSKVCPPSLYLSLDDRRGDDTVGAMKTRTPRPASFVGYLRVSREDQGRSGLGLEAQTAAIRKYVEDVGGRLVELVVEVDSGDNDDRPELGRALKLVTRLGATLVVAKLDRLARSVAKGAAVLRDPNVKVKVADSPEASVLELHLRLALAQEERRLISERTIAALAATKAKGTKLGSARPGHWRGREEARRRGAARGAAAAAAARRAASAPMLEQARGIVEAHPTASLRELAAALEAAGVLTATGCTTWTACGVQRLRRALETVGAP